MALDFNDLIRAFEPILYFAQGERFFPSDGKRYLERCALWNAVPPFDDHNSWHKSGPGSFPKPLIDHLQLSGRPDEPGTFLGVAQGGSFPFLFASGTDEGFLELTGWTDGQSVSPTSNNRFANLDQIEKLYNSAPTAGADPVLQASRFWYHAEVFDFPRLRILMDGDAAPANFKAILPTLLDPPLLGDPLLLCYYLFFPGHDEPLDNCADPAEAALFGSHAGEWACLSILLKCRVTDIPIGGGPGQETCTPVAVGLTSRNAGDIEFLGGERRVGMRVVDFNTLTTVTRDRGPGKLKGVHPRLFVAKGTHGLYPAPASPGTGFAQPMPFFAPEDSASQHCGASELLDKSLEDLDEEAEDAADDNWVDDSEVVWTKAGLLGPLWAGIEWLAGGGGGFTGVGSRTPDQFDHPPLRDAPGYFGAIVHPAGVDPPHGEETAQKFAWQFPLSNEAALQTQVGGRSYSMRVDRTSPDPLTRQVWWPGIQGQTGFAGRWGPRVARDPKARRAGMKFPEFWEMFMAAFAKSKSQ
jgi:hypothetical protein